MNASDLIERILHDQDQAQIEAREPLGMYVTKDELRELWHYLGRYRDLADPVGAAGPLTYIKIYGVPIRLLPDEVATASLT